MVCHNASSTRDSPETAWPMAHGPKEDRHCHIVLQYYTRQTIKSRAVIYALVTPCRLSSRLDQIDNQEAYGIDAIVCCATEQNPECSSPSSHADCRPNHIGGSFQRPLHFLAVIDSHHWTEGQCLLLSTPVSLSNTMAAHSGYEYCIL